MAIAFSVADAAQLGFQPTATLSFNAGTGTDRYMVGVVYQDRSTSETLTSASYAGVPMTELLAGTHSATGRDFKAYGLVAPATGTNTFSCSGTGNGTFRFNVTLAVYTGVHQSTAPSGEVEADFVSSVGLTHALDVVSQAGDLIVSLWAELGSNRAVGSYLNGCFERHNEQPLTSQRHIVFDKAGSGGQADTVGVNWSGVCDCCGVSLSLPTAEVSQASGTPVLNYLRRQMEVG